MAALMISSQLLLSAFVVYWLIGQYKDEKINLGGELEQEYVEIHDQLVDSMLMKHLVLPSLEDSSMMMWGRLPESFRGVSVIDTLPTVMMMQKFVVQDSVEAENEMVTIHLNASSSPDSGLLRQDVTAIISDEERMVRSVKLFISENPETFGSEQGLHQFAVDLDSISLIQNMGYALAKNHWKFELQWPPQDPGLSESAGSRGFLLLGGPGTYLPSIQIRAFNGYLLWEVAPQILFGIILLLLSGSALLVAHRSLRKQQALNRLRNDFVGNISHELKTPVSTVKVALEALRTFDLQKDPKVSGEYLEMAASELDRLEQLVGKVLHHELLDNPALVLEKQSCYPVDLLHSVLRTLDIPVKKAGATITMNEEGEARPFLVDRVYVEGVLINLVDNSLKYAGEQSEIEIQISYEPSVISLSVLDRGPGIPEEYKEQIFEKFFRIPSGDRHNVKGYGLGLNFAAQVIEKHEGSISFQNRKGGGSCFTLLFQSTEK